MTASPMSFTFTEDDTSSSGGGGNASYAALEPGDYVGTLVKVENYDYSDRGKSKGWIWHYKVEGLDFKDWTAFSQAARWKVAQVLEAFGIPVEAGLPVEIDPNQFIGLDVGVTIGWQKDPDEIAEDEPNYKVIDSVWALPSETPPTI